MLVIEVLHVMSHIIIYHYFVVFFVEVSHTREGGGSLETVDVHRLLCEHIKVDRAMSSYDAITVSQT